MVMATPDMQDPGHVFVNPWMPTPRQIACRRCRVRKKKASTQPSPVHLAAAKPTLPGPFGSRLRHI